MKAIKRLLREATVIDPDPKLAKMEKEGEAAKEK